MHDILYFDSPDVDRLLDYDGTIAEMGRAMQALSASAKGQPLRQVFEFLPDKLFGVMPGVLPNHEMLGAKMITVFPEPDAPGRRRHRGVVVGFDGETGQVVAIADAERLTAIRTACTSAAATAVLARPEATSLALFGYGTQAETHVEAIRRVRHLNDIRVWGRSFEKASLFASQVTERTGVRATAFREGCDAARNADILCTVSGSPEPILRSAWVSPGAHVNVVGSSYAGPVEIDSDLVVRSRYVVDSIDAVRAAGAEYLVALAAGLIDESHIVGEIGDVLAGRIVGRQAPEDVTIYKSLGNIVQDLAALSYLRRAAAKHHGGTAAS